MHIVVALDFPHTCKGHGQVIMAKACGLEQFWFCTLSQLDLLSLLFNCKARLRNLHNDFNLVLYEYYKQN